ncbi:hypothetical protein EVAR_52848_1 [Eumeta japonica]|uniref:Uncharacterized protein n=1 Tax=Eumeta variegata TaxID=151549 RepID=A0A4C1YEP7_EUMVA|nr:hypothetical protein EVAR_52848_1 [Eumeta japonica]
MEKETGGSKSRIYFYHNRQKIELGAQNRNKTKTREGIGFGIRIKSEIGISQYFVELLTYFSNDSVEVFITLLPGHTFHCLFHCGLWSSDLKSPTSARGGRLTPMT